MGSDLFCDCDKLRAIYCNLLEPFFWDYGGKSFTNDVLKFATLYVPVGTKDKYKEVKPWCNFKNIVEMGEAGIENLQSDNGVDFRVCSGSIEALNDTSIEVYSADGRKVAGAVIRQGEQLSLPSGLYIVRSGASVKKIVIR